MQPYTISDKKFFTLKYSAAIRIWHWLTFLLITASMITVLIASTLFEPKRGHPDDQAQRPAAAQQQADHDEDHGEHRFDPSKLDPETRAAFSLQHKVWDTHKLIGFGLCFLLLSRVVIEISRKKEDRLLSRINQAFNIPVQTEDERQDKNHFLWVKRGYLVFYILFLLMATTGLIMAFEDAHFLKTIQRPAREVHQIVQYLIYAYILFHLTGVIRADMKKHKGMVSAMINGGD